ncbi:hypothetical protein WM42_0395 [Corynebacterium simulans]|nr:hypothetical protein WM42_0395 [Corynebacterium simulans]
MLKLAREKATCIRTIEWLFWAPLAPFDGSNAGSLAKEKRDPKTAAL